MAAALVLLQGRSPENWSKTRERLDRERERQRRAFVARAGWSDAAQALLAGDASARRYARLTQGDATAVLMDDPPPGHSVGAFVRIARLLRGMGYSAPDVLAADEAQGFALIEDFGDDSFLLCSPAQRLRPSSARFTRLQQISGRPSPATGAIRPAPL